jgi:hypothetical protein
VVRCDTLWSPTRCILLSITTFLIPEFISEVAAVPRIFLRSVVWEREKKSKSYTKQTMIISTALCSCARVPRNRKGYPPPIFCSLCSSSSTSPADARAGRCGTISQCIMPLPPPYIYRSISTIWS